MSDKEKELSEHFSPEEVERLKGILSAEEKAKLISPKFSISKSPKWLIVLVGIAATVGLAFGYVRVIDPWIAQLNAEEDLNSQVEEEPIRAQNSELIPFTPDASSAGEIPPGVNPLQLGLGENGSLSEPAHFVFSSANADENSHVVDIYMDFYSQRSRDFISRNSSTLESLTESGKLVLRIYPVLNKEAFSIYAPEALAEVFATAPDKAWGFFTDLIQESATLTGAETSEQVVSFIANNAQENIGTCVLEGGNVCVDEASIVNATFLTWLYTASDDLRLAVGYIPPVIYVDGDELDQDAVTITDPAAMVRFFSTLS